VAIAMSVSKSSAGFACLYGSISANRRGNRSDGLLVPCRAFARRRHGGELGGPSVQIAIRALRHAEDVGEHECGHCAREVFDDVHRSLVDEAVDETIDDVANRPLERCHVLLQETLGDRLAIRGVLRRIHHDEIARRELVRVLGQIGSAGFFGSDTDATPHDVGGVQLIVGQRGFDVGESRQRPELVRRAAVQRRVRTELRVGRVRVVEDGGSNGSNETAIGRE
jgi:hypothetical protein